MRLPPLALALLAACATPPSTPGPEVTPPPSTPGPEVAPPPVSFRWSTDSAGEVVGLAACPAADDEPCRHLASFDPASGARIGRRSPSPTGQYLVVELLDRDGACTIGFYDVDGSARADPATTCNPTNGAILWIDHETLWISGGAGSGVGYAQLRSAAGGDLWTSAAIAHELSPGGRHALVGRNLDGGAWIDTVDVIDLRRPEAPIASVPVSGAPVGAEWRRDEVILRLPGGDERIIRLHADDGPPRPDRSGAPRPFSGHHG
ncbi:MAG: hypothetical protein H6711_05150 [Myxococcales bacterium]|nr:hypothetical protein [Myxococcales bacterium]